MTFAELISSTSWAEVKAALVWSFPDEADAFRTIERFSGNFAA